MQIKVTLSNSAGVLDCRVIDVHDDDDSAEFSEAIWAAIDDWILAAGDTIRIIEVA